MCHWNKWKSALHTFFSGQTSLAPRGPFWRLDFVELNSYHWGRLTADWQLGCPVIYEMAYSTVTSPGKTPGYHQAGQLCPAVSPADRNLTVNLKLKGLTSGSDCHKSMANRLSQQQFLLHEIAFSLTPCPKWWSLLSLTGCSTYNTSWRWTSLTLSTWRACSHPIPLRSHFLWVRVGWAFPNSQAMLVQKLINPTVWLLVTLSSHVPVSWMLPLDKFLWQQTASERRKLCSKCH